ncbi:MAG: histidine ammonia-lyase [Phycisphaerae bacterium]|nr:histidine ammonia-lyase [Phycisphaerae bacterium]
MADPATVTLSGSPLSPAQVRAVARGGSSGFARVNLSSAARERVSAARAALERRTSSGEALYGINTGFGSLSHVRVDTASLAPLQANLVRSHAAGVGEPLADEVVRATMLILAASQARGRSGVRPELIEQIIALLNACVTPTVPSRGSVGASGDLAPLAHIALVLIGEGHATHGGRTLSGADALRAAGLKPLQLAAKEGLALINGTHLMCAIASLGVCDASALLATAVRATALSIDACRATDSFLDARIHEARNQPGQQRVAAAVLAQLSGSTILTAHRENDPRVQDPYSFRCSPQVLGAAVDALAFVRATVERELGAVTDNPLVFESNGAADIVSGGNFHGMPMAIALDVAKIALAHVAGISERRVFWILAATDKQNPVRAYLSPEPGLHSGYMIAQYTAAACCNELGVLAHPASVGNISTSAGIEDYNSMGATSANHLRVSMDRAIETVAIELLVMCEGLEYQRPLRSGAGVEDLHAAVRRAVPKLECDRPPAPDIAALARMIRDGAFSQGVELA